MAVLDLRDFLKLISRKIRVAKKKKKEKKNKPLVKLLQSNHCYFPQIEVQSTILGVENSIQKSNYRHIS